MSRLKAQLCNKMEFYWRLSSRAYCIFINLACLLSWLQWECNTDELGSAGKLNAVLCLCVCVSQFLDDIYSDLYLTLLWGDIIGTPLFKQKLMVNHRSIRISWIFYECLSISNSAVNYCIQRVELVFKGLPLILSSKIYFHIHVIHEQTFDLYLEPQERRKFLKEQNSFLYLIFSSNYYIHGL